MSLLIDFIDNLRLRPALVDARNRLKYLLNSSLRKKNREIQQRGMPDGFGVPPPEYIYLITRQFDIETYYLNGETGLDSIEDCLKSVDVEIPPDWSVLDFGCGCGRVCRAWHGRHQGKIYGVDLHPSLVDWCQENLPFGEFSIDHLMTPLNYPDGSFDFTYAISVFTHLDEKSQDFWLQELARVLKPGGVAYITVHGPDRLEFLETAERDRFHQGEMVIQGEKYPGDNTCGAYHPESYVRAHYTQFLDFLSYTPGGARDFNQDAYLFRKSL